ncbi:permease prefix domain 1-containing protein [Agromyces sp. MMS24-JH15]|uniref:permease prefix domain 1-containing protein n=1 Tax=Agromyces sp. MMS24-JH15 TaxID=3243765 RepID=UPI003748A973
MTAHTLTDRYVWAAARSVAESHRADLERELRERIGDETDALVEQGRSPSDAERAALTTLGDPAALAATYLDRPQVLIGPRYYQTWWQLLKLLYAIVPASVGGAVILGQAISGASIGETIGTTVVTLITVSVHLGFWTTLVFAMMDRLPETTPGLEWTVDRLPQIPAEGRPKRRSDLIGALVYVGILAVLLVWQQFGAPWWGPDAAVPLLDPALWSFWLPYFLVLLVVEAVFAFAVYEWGMTWWLAGVNVLLNLAFAVPALWLLSTGQLFNPAALDVMGYPWGGDADEIVGILIVFAIVGIAVWDVLDGFLRARREAVRRRTAVA